MTTELKSPSCNLFVPAGKLLTYKHLVPGMIKYSTPFTPYNSEKDQKNLFIVNMCIEVRHKTADYEDYIECTWISGYSGKIWVEHGKPDERIIPNGIYSVNV